MKERFTGQVNPYALALLVPLAALGLSLALRPLFEPNPFLLFFVATVIVTASGGFGPGVVSIVFAIVTVNSFLLNNASAPDVSASSLVRLLLFTLASLFIAALHERMKQARQAADNAHRETRDILESISDAFFAVDEHWRFTYINQRAQTLWHQPGHSLIGQHLLTVFPELVESESYRQQQATMRDRQPRHFETLSSVVGGWIAVSAYPTDKGISVYFRDVTEQKTHQRNSDFLVQAGNALAASLDYEATLRTVANLAMPTIADWCAIDLFAEEGIVRRLVVAHADPAKVAWGHDIRTRNPVDLSATTGVAKVLRTGETEFYPTISEDMLIANSATEGDLAMLRSISLRSLLITPLVARGRVLGALTLATTADSGRSYHEDDLNLAIALAQRAGIAVDNAQLYQDAQQQREQLLVTLTSIGDAVIATDAQARVRFINPVAQALTGWHGDSAHGQPLSDVFGIINEFTRQHVESPADKVLREGQIVGLANHTLLLSRDGREIPIDDSGAPIRNSDGIITGVVLVFRDITERHAIERARAELLLHEQSARRAAEAANELKLRFLAMVSHELRTPLASIKGFTSTLLAKDVGWDIETQREFLTIMDMEADHLTDLVEQLLDVSRLQAGSLRIDILPNSLSAAFDLASAQLNAVARQHHLTMALPDELPPVLIDPQRISQVLVNLVTNAVKFSPEGSRITITAQRTARHIRVEVSDEGEGIPAEERTLVFEVFRQGVRRGGRQAGAGLGLAICRGIIEAHHGSIWIVERDGPGTTIAFTVPLAR